jgi:hypothetical protein
VFFNPIVEISHKSVNVNGIYNSLTKDGAYTFIGQFHLLNAPIFEPVSLA